MGLVDLPSLLTIEEAADFLRLDLLHIRRAVVAGELPAVRVDGRLLIDTQRLLEELGVCMTSAAGPRVTVVRAEPEADQ